MGRRTEEVRPVGAWVEPVSTEHHQVYSAVNNAQHEEERVHRIKAEKDMRLKQFQDEVRQRVTKLQKLKRQEELQRAYDAAEVERNIVRQSAFAAEPYTSRKNRCTLRKNHTDFSIKSQCGLSQDSGSEDDIESRQSVAFEEQSSQIKQCRQQARQKLTSRKLMTAEPPELPGGLWKTMKSDEHSPPKQHLKNHFKNNVSSDEETDNAEEIDACKYEDNVEIITLHSKSQGNNDDGKENQPELLAQKLRTVSFSETSEEIPNMKIRQPKRCRKPEVVPNIYPGVVDEEEKRRAQQQRVIYRRLFMDIERDAVKEANKRKEHRKKIKKLKAEKEALRYEIEMEQQRLVAPADPLTGETVSESIERERTETLLLQKSLQEQRERVTRNREMNRFLDALKVNLRERIEKQNLDLPPLCCCGPTVWDTNPDTCANNCVFYRNSKAYARALESLLASCDVA